MLFCPSIKRIGKDLEEFSRREKALAKVSKLTSARNETKVTIFVTMQSISTLTKKSIARVSIAPVEFHFFPSFVGKCVCKTHPKRCAYYIPSNVA